MSTQRPLGWRLSLILVSILILIWLPIEDNSTTLVFLLAAWLSFLLGLAFKNTLVQRRPADEADSPSGATGYVSRRYLQAGTAAGLAMTPIALLLMALKTGIHGHGTPDYTAEQIAGVLKLTPLWFLAGLSVGLLVAWRVQREG